MKRKMAHPHYPRGLEVVVIKAEGTFMGRIPRRDPNPQYIGKTGLIVGATESGLPVIALDDGPIITGADCWWQAR